MERPKKEKMRSKCSYTRNRNKLMMVMEGGLSSRIQVMESLSVLTDAYGGVLRACEELETYYETVKDSGNVSAVSNELEAIKGDFTEVEGIVKGYLKGTSRSSAKTERNDQEKKYLNGKKNSAELKRKSSERTRNAKGNSYRTFVARNHQQNQTKEWEKLFQVNYAAENESRKGNRKDLKRPRYPVIKRAVEGTKF